MDEESGSASRDDISGIAGSYKSTVGPMTPPLPSRVAPQVLNASKTIVIGGFDNPGMTFDTDFPREFTSVPMSHESKM